MKLLGNKGQAGMSIVGAMIVLLMVGFVGILSVTIYSTVSDSLSDSLSTSTSDAAMTVGNFTENVYEGYDLASNIPIVLAAGLLLTVIIGFAMYVRA